MAQWLRICLPVHGTWVRALVQEDSTCRGVTKPVSHNYWARVPQLLKPVRLKPVLHNKRSHCSEKPVHLNEEQPLLATTRESRHAATKTQRSQRKEKKIDGFREHMFKNNNNNNNKWSNTNEKSNLLETEEGNYSK